MRSCDKRSLDQHRMLPAWTRASRTTSPWHSLAQVPVPPTMDQTAQADPTVVVKERIPGVLWLLVVHPPAAPLRCYRMTSAGGRASEVHDGQRLAIVEHTFIDVPLPSSVWSGGSAGHKTCSSGKINKQMPIHGDGINPQKHNPGTPRSSK